MYARVSTTCLLSWARQLLRSRGGVTTEVIVIDSTDTTANGTFTSGAVSPVGAWTIALFFTGRGAIASK
jgi:hypothetical protein